MSWVRYWQLEIMRLISVYAALHALVTVVSRKIVLEDESKAADNSIKLNIAIAERDCLWVLHSHVDRRWWREANSFGLSLFSLSLISSIHSPVSLTQSWSERTKSEQLSGDSEWLSCVSSAFSTRHESSVVYKMNITGLVTEPWGTPKSRTFLLIFGGNMLLENRTVPTMSMTVPYNL